MKTINKGTQKYAQVLWTWERVNKGENLGQAYRGKVSQEKMDTFNDIWFRAHHTEGYNHDLKVVASSSWYYSTMYSFTRDGKTYVVYDTHANTYIFEV